MQFAYFSFIALQCPYDLCAPAIYEDLRPADMDQLTSVLYPNPSRGQFTVKAEGEFAIEIYDTQGKLVSMVENQIDEANIAHELPNGVYLVKVLTAGNTHDVHTLLIINN